MFIYSTQWIKFQDHLKSVRLIMRLDIMLHLQFPPSWATSSHVKFYALT